MGTYDTLGGYPRSPYEDEEGQYVKFAKNRLKEIEVEMSKIEDSLPNMSSEDRKRMRVLSDEADDLAIKAERKKAAISKSKALTRAATKEPAKKATPKKAAPKKAKA
jgi:hypothetical protein